MSDWKDACPGLLSNIHRILTVRFAFVCQQSDDFRPVLQQTFACTCFLYYNLCLCKSFKERAPEESASKVSHPIREAASPHLRVQRYAFSANWQNISRLFSKKDAFYAPIHYIYNTRAKEKKMGLMGLIFNGTQRHEDTKTQELRNSRTQKLKNSETQKLRNSKFLFSASLRLCVLRYRPHPWPLPLRGGERLRVGTRRCLTPPCLVTPPCLEKYFFVSLCLCVP